MVYSACMAQGRQKTEALSLRVTPGLKRLVLGIKAAGDFANEAEVIEAALRDYAERRKIRPVSAEEFEKYKAANQRPRGQAEAQEGE